MKVFIFLHNNGSGVQEKTWVVFKNFECFSHRRTERDKCAGQIEEGRPSIGGSLKRSHRGRGKSQGVGDVTDVMGKEASEKFRWHRESKQEKD